MAENSVPVTATQHTIADRPGLRNAWQWLAMMTMTVDHIGYLYNISALRYAGRLGMPLYAILFVITIQKHQIHLKRILLLGLLSQVQYLYIFQEPQLNIIFGFAIFAWTAEGIRKQNWLKVTIGFLMMWIPISYGWYLYFTLGTFYWLNNKIAQCSVFAVLIVIYTYLSSVHPRQLLAIGVPFLTRLKAPRPNKYLYRYFYPGHLLILAVLYYFITGTFTLPFGNRYKVKSYQTEPYYYYYDANQFYEDTMPYDMNVRETDDETDEI